MADLAGFGKGLFSVLFGFFVVFWFEGLINTGLPTKGATMSKSQLLQVLDDLIEKQTFSAAAADGIAALRNESKAAAEELAKARETCARLAKEKGAAEERNEEYKQRENAIISREVNIAEREKKMAELEKEVAVSKAVGAAFDQINQRILSNRIIREDIYHSNQVPIPNNSSGGFYTASQTETKQRTVKES
jgi:hypothetical protein